jgi:hypothetical protein
MLARVTINVEPGAMVLAFNAINVGGGRHFFAAVSYDGIPYAATDTLGQWKVLVTNGTTNSVSPSPWTTQFDFDDTAWTSVSTSFNFPDNIDQKRMLNFVLGETGLCPQA